MTLPLEEDPRPPFVQAAEVLRNAILEGEFQRGEKLPSARMLQGRFGIASSTVQNALRVLKDEGLVYSVMGRGSYVCDWLNAPVKPQPEIRKPDRTERPVTPPQDHRPPYIQTADALRKQIQDGDLSPGAQLPSARELQEQFGIASATAQNALRVLKEEGLIYSIQGRGVFVRKISSTREAIKHWDRSAERVMARARAEKEMVDQSGKSDEEVAAEVEQAKARLAKARADLDAVMGQLSVLVEDQKRRKRLRGERSPEDNAKAAQELRDRLNKPKYS
ncbi:winged helix-turn-helix domain-containing protein [Streptomyces sp. PH10-H1]|uniref:GntR family transcriptional regulator n=1 Tax=Streptomyces sp. PH10-H1 TaxID=3046212 RepID=UPI0024B97344|nr:winged helix-turn-helix domain-containing protein [Streptomyces sp. PH10-H1]MDJ0342518.1 winged helix-turn-helix domain-containing protein [Streptomyces sp. PH10-H1]